MEAARRDPRAFEPLYRKYVSQVYSFAIYELRDHHRAEDLTEVVFLRALAALPRFDERGDGERSTFRVWLFQIARNASPTSVGASVAAPRRRSSWPRSWPRTRIRPRPWAERDAMARAWRAIDRLPEDRRRALVLRFVEEMSTAEIAAILGRSEGAVRVLIHRALRAVAQATDGRGDAS